MNTLGASMNRMVAVPLSLEQVAYSLNQLSKADLEILEELMDRKFQKLILSRGEDIDSLYKRGQTISLKILQREFGK